MKLTYREDTYMMDKLFQLKNTEPSVAEILPKPSVARWQAVVFGGSYGIGQNIMEMLRENGAKAHSFSRSGTPHRCGGGATMCWGLSHR